MNVEPALRRRFAGGLRPPLWPCRLAVLTAFLWCAWTPAPASAQPPATIAVGDATIGQGLTGAVVVSLRDVHDLYGADVRLSFDPMMLQAEDANPAKPGVQVALGRFLSADLVVRNTADNVAGTVHVVVTQLNPAAPASGSGELFSVTFRALASGASTRVAVAASMLSSRDGIEIPAGSSSGVVTLVARSAAPATPTVVPFREPTLALPPATGEPTARPVDAASAGATPRRASDRRSTGVGSTSGTGAGGAGSSAGGPSGRTSDGQAASGGSTARGAGGAPGAASFGAAPDATSSVEPSTGPSGADASAPAPVGATSVPTGAAGGAPADVGTPAGHEAPAPSAPDASAGDAAAAEPADSKTAAAAEPASRRPIWPWVALVAVLVFAVLVAVVRRS